MYKSSIKEIKTLRFRLFIHILIQRDPYSTNETNISHKSIYSATRNAVKSLHSNNNKNNNLKKIQRT